MIEEDYKEVCFHEASHLVFNRLMQKLNIGFPHVKYVEILEPGCGKTEGGWLTNYNNSKARSQLKELKKMSNKHIIAQIMYQLAGFVSYSIFVDEEKDKCIFEKMTAHNFPSDIGKSNIAAGLISRETRFAIPDMSINDENLSILNSVKESVKSIMQVEAVKEAITFTANEICKKKGEKIEGDQLENLINRIDELIQDVVVEEYLPSI